MSRRGTSGKEPWLADLDPGIRDYVEILSNQGIETFESCQGGPGHAYPEPTVRFHGQPGEGPRALGVCIDHGLPVQCLRRVWDLLNSNEPTGPHWELVFWPSSVLRARAKRMMAGR